ncbi:MAG: serine/threonine-protein kinase [Polyangiaceae bacterium]
MTAEVEAGTRIGEKYVVERVLGSGGMGVVVAARHADLGQRVAIKLLKEGVLADLETEQRFFREARALATLQSDHVVRVHDVGRREDGTPFMVMEYLDGEDLSQVLARRKEVAHEEVVFWLLEACSGLAEAHARGLVHRDLKPGNLFLAKRLDGSSRVKVLDFGIAKSTKSRSNLTGASVFLGSPRYMSPEQLYSSRTVDARADIWSLGCVLFRLLSGKAPFDGDDLDQILGKIPAGQRDDLRQLAHGLPEALYDVVDRCLQPDREQRYGSVAELALALAPLAGDKGRELAERTAKITSRPMTTGTAAVVGTQPLPGAANLPKVDRGAPTRPLDAAATAALVDADTEPAEAARVSLEPTVDDPRLALGAPGPAAEASAPPRVAPALQDSTPPLDALPPLAASPSSAPSALSPGRPKSRYGLGAVVVLGFALLAIAVIGWVVFGFVAP